MAQQETSNGMPFADLANSIFNTMRDLADRYIEASAAFAKQILEFQAQSTNWAKDTSMAPMFQSQYSFNQGLIDFWQDAARALFQIEKPKSQTLTTLDGGL